MDWYLYSKLLHITFATLWFGGGVCMIVLGWAALRARDDSDLVRVVRQVVYLSERFFIPSSLLTVIFGAVMAWLIDGFGELWIILGLVGFGITFATGVLIIKPMADRVAAMVRQEAAMAAMAALCRRILYTSTFDFVVIFLVVAVMVLKPSYEDIVTLAVLAVILVGSGFWFLGTQRRAVAA
jgi:uncharacterized membrane protein